MDTATRTVLTTGDAIGLVLTVEAGFVSLIAVLVTIVMITINMVGQQRRNSSWHLMPMELYVVSLLVSGMVQAVGAVLSIHWIRREETYAGAMCTTQGAILQLGDTTFAMNTLAIALHTFVVIWFSKGANAILTAKLVVAVIWLYTALFVGIGISVNRRNNYEAPTPYWCWIGGNFLVERLFGEWIWVWSTLTFSLLAYIPLYFRSRGNITVNDKVWWKFSIHKSHRRDNIRFRPLKLLAYPLVDSILYLPLNVVHWLAFLHGRHLVTALFVVKSVYTLSGALNVLLLFTTRPDLLIFKRAGSNLESKGSAPLEMCWRRMCPAMIIEASHSLWATIWVCHRTLGRRSFIIYGFMIQA